MTATSHFLTETRSPKNGKLDAKLTAQALGLSLKELGLILKRDPSGLAKNSSSDGLQAPLQTVDALGLELREVFGTLEVGRMWLRAPNPLLADEQPLSYLLRGDTRTVQKLLRLAVNGMPT